MHLAEVAALQSPSIGHARLATSGDWRIPANNQPLVCGDVALAHNGTVPNAAAIARQEGLPLRTACDSEVLGWLIARGRGSLAARVRAAVARFGALPCCVLVYAPCAPHPHTPTLVVRRSRLPLYALPAATGLYLCSRPFPGAVAVPDDTVLAWTLDGAGAPVLTSGA